jgi:hypothetical protein
VDKKLLITQPSHYRSKRNLTVFKTRTRQLAPLALPYLAAITPPDWHVTLVEEYVGSAPDRYIVKAQLISENAGNNEIHDEPHRVVLAAAVHPKLKIGFDVPQGHSRELVPGKIWFGLSSTDPTIHTVDGWVWVMPERRTIWLRDVDVRHPFVFYQDGGKRELVFASVARNSTQIYLR